MNGRAEFRGVRAEPERFERNFGDLMFPWRRDSKGYALLIGQVEGDMALAPVGGDLRNWYCAAAVALQSKGYEVMFRAHPGTLKRGGPIVAPLGTKLIGGTLAAALAGAALVVTYNSNTAVESVLTGVPTVATDPGSMAWDVTSHSVEAEPVMPVRARWANELAWKQWTIEEMASGLCWERVGDRQCVPAV